MDSYEENLGGHLYAHLYENRNTLSSASRYVEVYPANEKKSATSESMYLPAGYSYICVGGAVIWPGSFGYHIRLVAA